MNASRRQLVAVALGTIVLLTIGGLFGYWRARSHPDAANAPVTSSAGGPQREPLYWYDPMQPGQHFDKPGKSPFMDMELIPKYADTAEEAQSTASGVKIDPTLIQNLGVRTTEVRRGILAKPILAVGSVGFNQRDVAVIQARTNGFVTRVYARAPGDVIGRNAPIVDLLVPDWVGAQTEFLALLSAADRDLTEAARQRLVLLGMPPELIGRIERTRKLQTTATIRSPLAGAIDSLEARQGMTISAGATLAKINGLATVWLEAAIPETQGALAQTGETVTVNLTAYPGKAFVGKVIAILPQANSETRTLRVRIELANRDGRLRPGMFAQARLDNRDPVPVLYVDTEAIIHTGTRAIALVASESGRFIPTQVEVGTEVDGTTVVLNGLQEGQRVVASGQFLIDSEASLKGVLTRLTTGATKSDTRPRDPESQP